MTAFDNPYRNIPDADLSRINADVPTAEYQMLQRIRLSKGKGGTIQTTINLLWNKLIYELKRRGITDYTECEAFERFVVGCQIVGPIGGPGSAIDGPCDQATQQDDRRGATQPSTPNTTASNVVSNLPSGSAGRRRRRGTTDRGGETKE